MAGYDPQAYVPPWSSSLDALISGIPLGSADPIYAMAGAPGRTSVGASVGGGVDMPGAALEVLGQSTQRARTYDELLQWCCDKVRLRLEVERAWIQSVTGMWEVVGWAMSCWRCCCNAALTRRGRHWQRVANPMHHATCNNNMPITTFANNNILLHVQTPPCLTALRFPHYFAPPTLTKPPSPPHAPYPQVAVLEQRAVEVRSQLHLLPVVNTVGIPHFHTFHTAFIPRTHMLPFCRSRRWTSGRDRTSSPFTSHTFHTHYTSHTLHTRRLPSSSSRRWTFGRGCQAFGRRWRKLTWR